MSREDRLTIACIATTIVALIAVFVALIVRQERDAPLRHHRRRIQCRQPWHLILREA
ncbi:hypothetical protein [Bradyrhizobium diazoefficiens]|uniref:hypothetical protein n=1 Tax=Bradyrhizobium diazoefficiens TaxID=1355477 RepID=UPI0012FEB5FC|nr:hypothetical protein [Bradyrhizobium diazoefficiens]